MAPPPALLENRELAGRRLVRDDRLLVDEVLMVWPAEKRGWPRRTAYVGPRQALAEVEPALARETGWAGGGSGLDFEATGLFEAKPSLRGARWQAGAGIEVLARACGCDRDAEQDAPDRPSAHDHRDPRPAYEVDLVHSRDRVRCYLRLILDNPEDYSTIEQQQLHDHVAAAPGITAVGGISRHPKGGYAVIVERTGDDLGPLLAYLRSHGYRTVL